MEPDNIQIVVDLGRRALLTATAGLFTATGINAALFHRQNSGRGMKIDVAMLEVHRGDVE